MKADLHVHSYFSDGTQSPEEIAELARKKGLTYLSVCDHNLTAAYSRLEAACAKEGVGLIQGVEIDVYWENQWLHLLAYDFDPESEGMRRLLSKSYLEMFEINDDMIHNMAADFSQINLAEYEIYQNPRKRGGFNAINYIYDKGLSESPIDGMKYLKKYSRYTPAFPDISKACRIIKAAGGIPILAHPGKHWIDDCQSVPAKFTALKTLGLEGVECYYPTHSSNFTRTCVDFCENNGMYITCGSDCHGEFLSQRREIGAIDVEISKLKLWSRLGYK